MSKVACQSVSKAYGASMVLHDLDLEVPEGSVVAVLGKSGSGKTTLLRIVAGFDRPGTGTVLIDGEVVDSGQRFVPPNRRRVGFVTQEGDLFPHLTLAKNVAFGLPRSQRRSGRVEEMLALVGLEGLGDRLPHQLSGGQQQRAAIARALAPRPGLMLLDEPFSSLDASLRASLRSELVRILRSQGTTTILVTHDQAEALSVADKVAILDRGHVRQFSSPEQLYTRPVEAAVAQFLGEANLLPGQAARGRVVTPVGTMQLAQEASDLAGPVTVLVRPEQLAVSLVDAGTEAGPSEAGGKGAPGASEPGGASGAPRVVGQVVHREYYGHDSVLIVALRGSGTELRVRCNGRATIGSGDTVEVCASEEVVAWPAPA